jgi:M6 family metalloprotease-like protein
VALMWAASVPALAQEQWRILALRVDFPLEEPDEFTTTGVGSFDLRSAAEALPDYFAPYDLPPHDRDYFASHLEALARYYRTVSEGQVEIDFAVYPSQNSDAYTLPRSALDYGNGRTPEEIGVKWAELLRDAVALADADADGPVFADFNSFLVFHAGPGHETGQLNDIRTVYLAPEDLEAFLDEPLRADDGAFTVPDGWILPEAVSLQGRAGLNGLLAKFFGHQLGLPGLSNFADGLPALGGWSLMDVGANRLGYVLLDGVLEPAFGFVPPHPIAWTKTRLGWIDPVEVRRDTVIQLLATDRQGDLPKAIRLPVNDNEYFLLENRQVRGRQGIPAGVEAPFGDTAAVWLDPADIDFSGEQGLWVGVKEYDAFVPGSGVLVWHVDDKVIDAGLADGSFNNEPVRQGIALEEADGYRDIGNPLFDRIENIEGAGGDAFFAGGTSLFGLDTIPNSASNDGLASGIEVEVLSPPGDTMRVSIRFTRAKSGWPRAAAAKRLRAADLDDDGKSELVGEGDDGLVLWDAEGNQRAKGEGGFIAAGGSVIFAATEQGTQAWNVVEERVEWVQDNIATGGLFSASTSAFPGRKVLALEGEQLVILDAVDGTVLLRDDSPAELLSVADLDGDGAVELVAIAGGTARALGNGAIQTLWNDGPLAPSALASADLDGDGRAELIIAADDGIQVRRDGQILWRFAADARSLGSPALGDLDGDGLLEIVSVSAARIYALRGNGLEQGDFPFLVPRFQQAGDLGGGAVLLDIDADGRQEIFAAAERGVYGVDDNGSLLAGFPLSIEGIAPGQAPTPVGADFDGDGWLELAVPASDRVYVWDLQAIDSTYRAATGAWLQEGGGSASNYAAVASGVTVSPQGNLLPAGKVYCYPNPVGPQGQAHIRYYLETAAQVQLEVFDALGERVERLVRNQGRAENEIAWSTVDYASGLYVCRLEARTAGNKEVVFINMAVSQ